MARSMEGRRSVCTPTTRIAGIALFQCAGHAADQSTTADGHDDRLQALHLLQQLETDRPLTIDDGSVIERMHERHPLQLADAERFITGLVVVRAVQDHVGSKSTGGRNLHQRSHEGHDNARQDAALGGVVGHGLGVISGAGSDHAAPLLIVTQQQNPVERTAFFEGSGPLQIIQLEKDLLTGNLGERGRELARREIDEIANSLFCFFYLIEGNVHS